MEYEIASHHPLRYVIPAKPASTNYIIRGGGSGDMVNICKLTPIPTPVEEGSPDVFAGGFPVHGVSMLAYPLHPPPCNSPRISIKGSSAVFVNGLPVARMNDDVSCAGGPSYFMGGLSTVIVGD